MGLHAGPAPPPTPNGQQTVACTLDQGLAVGADAPALQMLVQLAAAAPSGAQTNTATVSSPTPGQDGTSTGTVTVARSAQFAITKTHSGTGEVGQTVDFHLAITNNGPSDADQMVVTDPLPTGLTYVSASGTGWTCGAASNIATCALAGPLPAGSTAAPITLTATVEAAAYDHVVNIATVSSTDPDLSGRASASDQLAVDPDAILALSKQHTGQFTVGQPGIYEIVVSNTGPTATPGPLQITDPLPPGLSYSSASGDGWTCSGTNNQVTCTNPGPLAVGASSALTITVNVLAAAVPTVINTATATSPGGPSISATDIAPVPAPVAPAQVPSSPASQDDLRFTGFGALLGLLIAAALTLLGSLTLLASRQHSRQRRRQPQP